MKGLNLGRAALTMGVGMALLTGCGGSQPPVGTPGAAPQGRAIATNFERAESWMTQGRSGQDLLYVSASGRGDVYVFTYPQGKPAGTLSGLLEPNWECSDSSGDVFIVAWANPSFSSSIIYEYAHGGTSPIASFSDPGKADGCSVDPTTNALAVANEEDSSNPYGAHYGDVAVFPAEGGSPTIYYSSQDSLGSCGYDSSGNLYLMGDNATQGYQLVRLGAGSASFEVLKLDKTIHAGLLTLPSVQWDGTHMTVSSAAYPQGRKGAGTVSVYRLSISGSSATVIGTTKLLSKKNRHSGQSWIQGNRIIGFDSYNGFWNASFWPYPAGGNVPFAIKKILATNKGALMGVTVSVGSPK